MEEKENILETYVVKTTSVVAVGDDLDGAVGTLGDVEIGRDGDTGYAEISRAEFLDGWEEDGVEAVAYIVTDGQGDLEQVFGVTELDGNGQGC